MNDTFRTTISVIVDRTAKTTVAKQAGVKCPLSSVQSTSQAAYRAALRDAAYQFLYLASQNEPGMTVADMVKAMCWENGIRPVQP